MNYSGFFLYGLCALTLLVGSIYIVVLIKNKRRGWPVGIGLILVGVVLLMFFGRSLYHRYTMDEQLVAAAKRGDAVTVGTLLARGANPNVRFNNGFTALKAAESAGHLDVVGILRRAGAHE